MESAFVCGSTGVRHSGSGPPGTTFTLGEGGRHGLLALVTRSVAGRPRVPEGRRPEPRHPPPTDGRHPIAARTSRHFPTNIANSLTDADIAGPHRTPLSDAPVRK